MHDYRKTVKLTLVITYISMVLLVAAVITLPAFITWYVEVKGRDQNLPAIIMLTCYPCAPFVGVALICVQRILKCILSGVIFGDKNITALKKLSHCCLAISLITLVAGFFYTPFFVVCIVLSFCSLAVKVIKDIFDFELQSRRDEIYEDMRENYEEDSNISNR